MADSRLIDLSGSGSADPDAAFYFDLSRPESWLVAERIIHTLGRPAPWIPILESELAASPSQLETLSFEQVAERAAERGLLPFKPPAAAQLPNRDAMLAATYAQQAGKTVAWARAAMRQSWCAGRDMADRDTLYSQPRHPYTHSLLSAVPLPDPDSGARRERILLTGDLPSPINPPSGCVFHTRCWKAQEQCKVEVPLIREIAVGHQIACHFPEDRPVFGQGGPTIHGAAPTEQDLNAEEHDRELLDPAASSEAAIGHEVERGWQKRQD